MKANKTRETRWRQRDGNGGWERDNGENSTRKNRGPAYIKQFHLKYTCQGAVTVRAIPAVLRTLPDPRAVKYAMLDQKPYTWSQICQTSAIPDHRASESRGLSNCASVDSLSLFYLLCLPDSQISLLQVIDYVWSDAWSTTLKIAYCLNSSRAAASRFMVWHQSFFEGVRFWVLCFLLLSLTFTITLPESLSPLHSLSNIFLTSRAIDGKVIKYSCFETPIFNGV